MSAMITAEANAVLDARLGGSGGAVWLALSEADPTADGSGLLEPTDANYGRLALAGKLATAAARVKASNDALTFFGVGAAVAVGTITHAVAMDASSGGNPRWAMALVASKAIGAGDTLTFASGDIQFTLPWS